MTDSPGKYTPQQLADAAFTAASRGDTAMAAERFAAAARGFLAAGDGGGARAALSNLAHVRKQAGDYRGALAAADEAVALFAPDTTDKERGYVLLTRAGVLDRLADPAAFEAWTATVKAMRDQPAMMAVCLAHAAGARVATHREEGLLDARVALQLLGERAPLPLVVGAIGAVGDSAPGAAGIPFLAQAAWLMQRHPETCNPSNAPFLDMLVERVGGEQAITAALCLLGLGLASARQGTADHAALRWWADRMLQRCAAARSITVEAMADEALAWADDLDGLAAALEQLVGDAWVIERGAARS